MFRFRQCQKYFILRNVQTYFLSGCRKFFPRGIKQPGGEVSLSHLFRAEVRNDWSNDFSSVCLYGVYKDILTLFTITGPINLFITKSKQAYLNLDVKFTVWWKKLTFFLLSYCFREVRLEVICDILKTEVRTFAIILRCRLINYFKIIWFSV